MPAAPLEEYNLGQGSHGVVEYNDANGRISRFYWEGIPPGVVVTATIFDTLDPSYPDPVFSQTLEASGEQPIAGNHSSVTEVDPFDGAEFQAVPPNITVIFTATAVG